MINTNGLNKVYRMYSLIIILGASALFGFSNRISSLYYSDFMCLFMLVGSFLIWCLIRFRITKSIFNNENNLYMAMIVIGIVVSHFKFGQSWYYTLKEAIFLVTSILTYYVMSAVYDNYNKVEELKNAIIIGASISSIISIIAALLLRSGFDLLDIGEFLKERNGLPRFSYGTTLVVISFFISLMELRYGRKKKKYIINLVLDMINILFIMQTRTMILYIFLSIIVTLVLLKKHRKAKFRITITLLIAFFVVLLNLSDYLYLNTNYYGDDAGIRVRFEAITHYWNYFVEEPLFGVGFLTSGDNPSINYIVHGPWDQYNISDVGIFGFLLQHGIVGIIWLVLWFKKIINTYIKFNLTADSRQSALVMILIIFYLITMINLMFNSHPLFLNVPILMIMSQSLIYYSKSSEDLNTTK